MSEPCLATHGIIAGRWLAIALLRAQARETVEEGQRRAVRRTRLWRYVDDLGAGDWVGCCRCESGVWGDVAHGDRSYQGQRRSPHRQVSRPLPRPYRLNSSWSLGLRLGLDTRCCVRRQFTRKARVAAARAQAARARSLLACRLAEVDGLSRRRWGPYATKRLYACAPTSVRTVLLKLAQCSQGRLSVPLADLTWRSSPRWRPARFGLVSPAGTQSHPASRGAGRSLGPGDSRPGFGGRWGGPGGAPAGWSVLVVRLGLVSPDTWPACATTGP